ncbi:hypothetical protein EV188_104561 [Actinomycetospora succinea]|uniref:Uncharacterized protein n=1 Tax=Actinomycetospora succinea TaxID=663603 RepID=A0A4R6VDK3_9PSEU|nr:hypothetical protein [Actinomycetospora succinea]TDQ58814.1 hypothetical protein EV188_104561 [Actinomycetospora succinea]
MGSRSTSPRRHRTRYLAALSGAAVVALTVLSITSAPVAGADAGPDRAAKPRPTTTTTTAPPTTTTTAPPTTTTTAPPSGGRDPLRQPFASSSIWNMPIGSGAVYVPANLPAIPGNDTGSRVPQIDDEPIVLSPGAPLTQVLASSGGWGGNRCKTQKTVLATVPIPANYVLPSDNKNQSASFLAADGRTVVSTQPLARCAAGGPATSYVRYPDQDIYGPGIQGSHGGSGMSGLGGSIRVGELRPGEQGPRHALKINLYARGELAQCATRSECFRWPAVKSDSYAVGWYGAATGNTNTAMRMGSLLAIPPDVDLASLGLQTEPARQIAWTLQNYGAYVVDDTYGPSFALNAEHGPGGNTRTQFRNDYGLDFEVYASAPNAWSRDLQRLRTALAAVDNNSPTSVGGGGTPRQPLLPELTPPASAPGARTQATEPATAETRAPGPVTSTPAVPAR